MRTCGGHGVFGKHSAVVYGLMSLLIKTDMTVSCLQGRNEMSSSNLDSFVESNKVHRDKVTPFSLRINPDAQLSISLTLLWEKVFA
jgi:hypothetical protein